MTGERLSWRAAALSLVLPIPATFAVGFVLAAPSDAHHLVQAFRSIFRGHPSTGVNFAPLPAAWLHGKTLNLDRGLYYALATAIPAFMFPWVLAALKAQKTLPRSEGRVHAGMTIGTWISAVVALAVCVVLGAGFPQYQPLVILVVLVSLQALIAGAGLPLVWMANQDEDPDDPNG